MQTPAQEINANLTKAAANLAKSSPNGWQAFVEAMSMFAEHHRHNLVMSPLPELPINQGRAQILSTLTDNLRNCVGNADKLEGKK